MRPDVAVAFDRLAASARRAGINLTITSAYRPDAEQAELFAANPDPRWVAPPGTSLHRCATELNLGPPSAYGWLFANARRFGFLKHYPWECDRLLTALSDLPLDREIRKQVAHDLARPRSVARRDHVPGRVRSADRLEDPSPVG
jgi:D-alanyl-D-alanine carboxypeptidase